MMPASGARVIRENEAGVRAHVDKLTTSAFHVLI